MINFSKNKKDKNTSQKFTTGFTLIETLVAVSIFTLAVVSSMMVLSRGLSSTTYAKQKVIATYLAQEGIEYVRNMRDTFMLYNTGGTQAGWNAFNAKLIGKCDQPAGCFFGDLTDNDFYTLIQPITGITITSCTTSCPQLLYDANTGKYNYTSGISSPFSRKITVTVINSDELKVSSTISWSVGPRTLTTTLSENLFNWIQ